MGLPGLFPWPLWYPLYLSNMGCRQGQLELTLCWQLGWQFLSVQAGYNWAFCV